MNDVLDCRDNHLCFILLAMHSCFVWPDGILNGQLTIQISFKIENYWYTCKSIA